MTKTDIRNLYRILALLQADSPDTALAVVLVTRLLRKWDKAYMGTKIAKNKLA